MTSGPLTKQDVQTCAACPHPWDEHDTIASRFCTATIAGAFSRGCVCTPHTGQEPAAKS